MCHWFAILVIVYQPTDPSINVLSVGTWPDSFYDDDDDIQVAEAVIKTRPNIQGNIRIKDGSGWVVPRPPSSEPTFPEEPNLCIDDFLSQISPGFFYHLEILHF
ncbi:hypothetical protein TNCV_3095001 [Trichonephila clavipes]|nr:hypothetical protein TNCV_3095001 [Trichonephila clavipes]